MLRTCLNFTARGSHACMHKTINGSKASNGYDATLRWTEAINGVSIWWVIATAMSFYPGQLSVALHIP